MPETHVVRSVAELERALSARMKKLERDAHAGIARAARRGVAVVRKRVPKAFGEVADSVHADGERIVIDAPHAAPVETGSRPHMPPLAPLIAYVRLKAITPRGRVRRRTVLGGMVREHTKQGTSREDAVVLVAKAIQRKIAKEGTKPNWYALNSLEELHEVLGTELEKVFR